jgi:SAM-dependent methyltransferase
MNYEDHQVKGILNEIIIDVYGKYPIILSDLWSGEGERNYIDFLRPQYERIVLDFNKIFNGDSEGKRVIEISSFLGVVDIVLSKIGFETYTFDIPEFQNNDRLNELYSKFNVHPSSGNIKDIGKTGLPYPDNFFDGVILSEVIEHLNINPLPVFQEIHRILKKDGILYITTPNQVKLLNRIMLARGQSVRNPISHSVIQLDRTGNTTCGIHWREYTLQELIQLLASTGFSLVSYSYCPSTRKKASSSFTENLLTAIGSLTPGLKEAMIVISKKEEHKPMEFRSHDEYIKYITAPES